MNIKLIVTDLDGTLLNSKKEISLYNRNIIKMIKERNILFCIASGRPFNSVLQVIEKNDICSYVDFIIAYNGYSLYNTHTNQLTTDEKLSVKEINDIISRTRKMNFNVIDYDGDNLFALYEDKVTGRIETYNPCKCVVVGENYFNYPVPKIMITNEVSLLNQFYENHCYESNTYRMFKGNSDLIEFMKKGISKGKALQKLIDKEKLNANEIMAFGDQDNDLELLELVNYSVAMGNSENNIKEKCWASCLTNDNDGVGRFINECIIESK